MNDNSAENHSGMMPDSLRQALHCREAVCAEIENLVKSNAQDPEAELARLTEKFRTAPEVPAEYAEVLEKRLAQAVKEFSFHQEEMLSRIREQESLAGELENLLAAGELATYQEAAALKKRITALELSAEKYAGLLSRFSELFETLSREEEANQQNIAKAQELICALENLLKSDSPETMQKAKPEIENTYNQLKTLPRNIDSRYQELHREISVKLAQHYETLDLARWESYTLKMDLCKKLEALQDTAAEGLPEAGRQLQDIRNQWKQLGSVPKEKNEELNASYLELTRKLQHRVDEFFSARRQEQKSAAAAKTQLCERAEALADSTNWKQTANEFKAMQQEWKALAHSGNAEKQLFARFRQAADQFFQSRSAAYSEVEKRYQEITDAKMALIERAQNLALENFRDARKLREEFQAMPNAGRSEAELRRKFNSAMDKFFSERQEAFQQKEAEAKALLEELKGFADSPEQHLARAREIRTRLQELNCRNLAREVARELDNFGAALKKQEKSSRADKLEIFSRLQEQLSAFLASDGENCLDEDSFAGFPKLLNAYRLIADSKAGNEEARKKLDKLCAAQQQEAEKILSQLRPAQENAAPKTLAEELEAAILGNFARKEAEARGKNTVSKDELEKSFLNLGFIPATAFAGILQEFTGIVNAGK